MARPTLLNRLALLWTVVVIALLAALFSWRTFDDPFITFRYAQNIASGHGFVYNPGERVLSTTTPLYALILALVSLAGLDMPLTSTLLGCISLGLGGLALWHLGQVWRAPLAGAAGLLLYPTFPLMILTLGGETLLAITLILFGFLAYAHQRYVWVGMLFALATLTRADGVLAVAVAGAAFLLTRRHHPIPWRGIILYLAVSAPWFLFSWRYFGSPFPITLAAKRMQGAMAESTSFFDGLLALWFWGEPLYACYLLLAVAGVVTLVRSQHAWLPLIGWSVLYLTAYSVLGVTSYLWYYAPLIPGLVMLTGLGISAVYYYAERASLIGQHWLRGICGILIVLLLVAQGYDLASYRDLPDTRVNIYRTTGEWLYSHTPADASVGALEVGIIGYYAQRRMIDFAALIQPETLERLAQTRSFSDTMLWSTRHFRPDYLVLQQSLVPHLDAAPDLRSVCHPLQTFEDEHYTERLIVYECW